MKINKILLVIAIVVAMIGDGQLVSAQGSVSVDQSQFNSLLGGPWAFNWQIDSGIVFTTNGQTSYSGSSPLQYDSGAAEWSISITFNGAMATVTAQSSYLSGAFNWQLTSPMSSSSPITSLTLGNSYGADNNETMSISGITINDGIPINGTLTVDSSQVFSGILINSPDPINQINYTLTANTPSTWERQDGDLSSVIGIPGMISPTPEPSTVALVGVGLSFLLLKIKSKK